MPCRDDRDSCVEVSNTTELKALRKKLSGQEKKLDKYARLLCFVCTNINIKCLSDAPPDVEHGDAYNELCDWWKAHQEFDRIRLEKEAVKLAEEAEKIRIANVNKENTLRKSMLISKAMGALTPSEREFLRSL